MPAIIVAEDTIFKSNVGLTKHAHTGATKEMCRILGQGPREIVRSLMLMLPTRFAEQ